MKFMLFLMEVGFFPPVFSVALLCCFSLALLQLIGVKIPQKHSQSHSRVVTDAPHPCTHTGSWITIFFVKLIALLCLSKNQVGGM